MSVLAIDPDDLLLADAAAGRRFRAGWTALDAERRPLLVYNSGRSVGEMRWLALERRVPEPEFIIGGNGTEVHDPIDAHAATAFHEHIAEAWDVDAICRLVATFPGTRPQPPEYLNTCKLSWYWPQASATDVLHLERCLKEAGFELTVNYVEEVFLDLLPRRAGKGAALDWLCRRIGVPLEQVIVAGTSANNRNMFALPGVRAILVAGASSSLRTATVAVKPCEVEQPGMNGLLAGLVQLGVLANATFPGEAESP